MENFFMNAQDSYVDRLCKTQLEIDLILKKRSCKKIIKKN